MLAKHVDCATRPTPPSIAPPIAQWAPVNIDATARGCVGVGRRRADRQGTSPSTAAVASEQQGQAKEEACREDACIERTGDKN